MKVERISANKIKVTVTIEDLNRWGVNPEMFAEDCEETRELFRTLIRRAEYETGFSVENSRVMVEAIPHKYEGLTVYVTKLDPSEPTRSLGKFKLRAKPIDSKKNYEMIHCFDELEDLCAFTKQRSALEKSDLYMLDGKYYIIFKRPPLDIKILEYAGYVPEISPAYLREYGKEIAKGNALGVINKYFK